MQIGRCISVVGIDPRYRVLIRFRHSTRVANGGRALKVQRCIGHGHLLASEIVGPRRRSQRGLVFLMVLWGFQARVRLLSNARRTLDQSLEIVQVKYPLYEQQHAIQHGMTFGDSFLMGLRYYYTTMQQRGGFPSTWGC